MQDLLFPISDAKPQYSLRPYQKRALKDILDGLADAGSRGLYVSATGTGKTEVGAAVLQQFPTGLIIEPYIELCAQTASRLRAKGLDVGVEQAHLTSNSPYTVACYASLQRRRRAEKFLGTPIVIVDEVHINYSQRSLEMLQQLCDSGSRLLGMTATPERGGDPLVKFYQKVLHYYPISEAENDGYLVPSKIWMTICEDLDFSDYRNAFSDFDETRLAALMTKERVVETVASMVAQHFENKPSVVFAAGINQAEAIVAALRRRMIDAVVIHSDENRLPPEERAMNLSRFESGDCNIVVNVGCLLLGWDHPPIAKVFIARPTLNAARYRQMYGRGTRPLPRVIDGLWLPDQRKRAIAESAKPHFEVFDITDSSRHNSLQSAVNVLLDGYSEEVIARVRKRTPRAATASQVDQIAKEEAAALAAEENARLALLQAEREAVATGQFRSYGRDGYAEAEGLLRRSKKWHMLYGKYRGWPVEKVPLSYLRWFVENASCRNEAFMAAIRRQIAKHK